MSKTYFTYVKSCGVCPCVCACAPADHGLQEMQLVILKPSDPSVDMRVLLSSHAASHKLTYLNGSPFVVEVRC